MQRVLEKIEEEIKHAKASSSEARMRERIQSIKTLCELVLEEGVHQKSEAFQEGKIVQIPPVIQSIPVSQPKKLEMDDDANGDSLLDF